MATVLMAAACVYSVAMNGDPTKKAAMNINGGFIVVCGKNYSKLGNALLFSSRVTYVTSLR